MLINSSNGDKKSKSRGNALSRGVLLLSVSTLVCKIIGLFFKIPIIHIVGIEGMAFFSSAYNVYMLLNSIAAAGLPVALSIMISKNSAEGKKRNIKKIFRVSMWLFVSIGLVGSLLLFYGAGLYSDSIGIPNAASAVRAIAPTVFFITIAGGLRGFFQGHENMAPTAVSQLIESLGKLVLGVGLALWATRRSMDLPRIAAFAVVGLSLGVLLSVVYLLCSYIIFRKRDGEKGTSDYDSYTEPKRKIISQLFWIALPVTLSSCLTSITTLADTALITNGLITSGFSEQAAIALYSSYTNLAIPMFNLTPALVSPLAVSLIPALTSALTREDKYAASKIFSSSVRLCLAFAVPASAGIAVFSKPILDLIYPSEAEACAFAAPLLSLLSAAIVFSCLTTVLNAVLQSHMKPALPIVAMMGGAVVKIILEYVLVRTAVGIYGAPISTLAGCFAILSIDIAFVNIHTPYKLELSAFLKSFAATAVCITAALGSYCVLIRSEIPFALSLILTIFLAVAVYVFSALKLGVISSSEIAYLPMGSRMLPFLRKLKLIK